MTDAVPTIRIIALGDINKVCQGKSKIDVQDIEKYWMTRFFRRTTWSKWMDGSSSFRNAMQSICDSSIAAKLATANYDKELSIKDSQQKQLFARYHAFDSAMSPLLDYACISCPMLADHVNYIDKIDKITKKLAKLQDNLSDENLAFLPEYRNKVSFLKDLGFLNSTKDTIKLKGM